MLEEKASESNILNTIQFDIYMYYIKHSSVCRRVHAYEHNYAEMCALTPPKLLGVRVSNLA